jgi:tripartite-type tricarboxylate transporter receptor subunit TctC
MAPHITGGRLKALAITGPKRTPALPSVPTLAEAGLPFDSVGWYGVFAPRGTPEPIVERLNAAFVAAVNRPKVQESLLSGGSLPINPPLSATKWTEQFHRDIETWGHIARTARVTID